MWIVLKAGYSRLKTGIGRFRSVCYGRLEIGSGRMKLGIVVFRFSNS